MSQFCLPFRAISVTVLVFFGFGFRFCFNMCFDVFKFEFRFVCFFVNEILNEIQLKTGNDHMKI